MRCPFCFHILRFGRGLANGFNHGFDRMSAGYSAIVRRLVSTPLAIGCCLLVFVGLLGATWYMGRIVPRGFIPLLDQGYAIVVVQLSTSMGPSSSTGMSWNRSS